MDFKVTVRTFTGAIRDVEVKDMPNEEAARAEAIATTFGQVLAITRTDEKKDELPSKYAKRKVKRRRLPDVERELKPGETETIVTGYDNNPLTVFSLITGDSLLDG